MINEISIIIPTLNEEHYLPKLLTSIRDQRNYRGKLEVIVVDGGSQDRTTKVAQEFKESIKNLYITSAHRGISHQRNIGANTARHKNLIFLDADMVLTNEFLSKISEQVVSERFVALPLVLPLDGSFIDYCYTFFSYSSKLILSLIRPVISGKCIVTTKENHRKISGFDEKAVFAEDIDYGFRSIATGAKYYLYFKPHLYTSIRRRKELGIIKLNILQFRGYIDNIRKGAITDKSKYNYKFGKH